MERLLWVSLGGAAGTAARYLVSGWVVRLAGPTWPFGTFTVNFLGSFTLALLMIVGTATDALSPELRLALTTGAMGGFTTYSTFSYETAKLLEQGAWTPAILNVTITVVVCLAATFLGLGLGRWLTAS